MAIRDIPSLHRHLQWAIELEHSTIPPYLTALYSIEEGRNPEAASVLLSVAIEEMLHMTLAANVLNAVGGTPRLDHPGFVPQYPSYLPHSNRAFQVPLSPFSRETIETFLKIEKPEDHDAMPEDENYETIGQFYEALEEGLVWLADNHGANKVFTGDPMRQLAPSVFHYDGSGTVVVVTDLATARQALEQVVDQGEGLKHQTIWDGDQNMFHPKNKELSHYFRLQEIVLERCFQEGDTPQSGPSGGPFPVDWSAVHNMRPNPRTRDYPRGSAMRAALEGFNQTYSDMLRAIHASFNGRPEMMDIAVGLMYEIKVRARELVRMPTGDGVTTVGLTFEYAPPAAAGHVMRKAKKVTVRPNGPYIVEGDIPLARKHKVMSALGEALTWKKEAILPTESTYALCRCGKSDTKPFCDGNHVRSAFDGTETAKTDLRADRAADYPGTQILVKHDRTICAVSTFCENKISDVWEMSEHTEDVQVRSLVMAMIERCPSGALTYEVEGMDGAIEPDLPEMVSVITDGPLWVTGNITVERADGQPAEPRNRVTLCRCGESKNKPFCDGSHIDAGFKG